MLPRSLNKSNRLSNHIRGTSLHFRDPTDQQSLPWKRREEGGGCISAMDLLTKTGPISGAVWARGMERLQLDAHRFSSLQAVRNKACISLFASVEIGLGLGNKKKKMTSHAFWQWANCFWVWSSCWGWRPPSRSHDKEEIRHGRAHGSCLHYICLYRVKCKKSRGWITVCKACERDIRQYGIIWERSLIAENPNHWH